MKTAANARDGLEPGRVTLANIRFAVMTCVLVLVAHAIAFLTHEYSHSWMAWALGWMEHPWAIEYGHPTLDNIIFLGQVEDNVSYDPIFASGHGLDASIIALSGPFLGNGLLYFLLFAIARTKAVSTHRGGLSVIYWLSLMCVANVWSYVPIRAITTHGDIALAARGLGLSPWLLFPVLTAVSFYMAYHFFCRMFPFCSGKMAAGSRNNFTIIIAVTSYWYFSFFVGDGIGGSYGLITQVLAIASRYFLFPLCAMYLASRSCTADVPESDCVSS
jgi:hypothetical protein